jgi:sec-independent protein translocase protein TatA
MVPLQVGIPGGPELVVVLLIFVLMVGVPAAIVLLVVSQRDAGGSDEALEARVERLDRRVERLENDGPD